MQIKDIIFLPDIVDKLDRKHNVIPDEVMDILFGKPLYRKVQKGHIPGEDVVRWPGTDPGRALHDCIFRIQKDARSLGLERPRYGA